MKFIAIDPDALHSEVFRERIARLEAIKSPWVQKIISHSLMSDGRMTRISEYIEGKYSRIKII